MSSLTVTNAVVEDRLSGYRCIVCDQPTVRLVDGEPSCDSHANQVYEQQWEDYTKRCVFRGSAEY